MRVLILVLRVVFLVIRSGVWDLAYQLAFEKEVYISLPEAKRAWLVVESWS